MDQFKIGYVDNEEFNFSFIGNKGKKEFYCFNKNKKKILERIFFKVIDKEWQATKIEWEFNKYILPDLVKTLVEKEKIFSESIISRKIEQKKRDYFRTGKHSARASINEERGISICEKKVKHIKSLLSYLDPNFQLRAKADIEIMEEKEENGK